MYNKFVVSCKLGFYKFIEGLKYMDKDDEEEIYEKMKTELDELKYEDFFDEELYELPEPKLNSENPFCPNCNVRMFSLIYTNNNRKYSKCHKCKHSILINN